MYRLCTAKTTLSSLNAYFFSEASIQKTIDQLIVLIHYIVLESIRVSCQCKLFGDVQSAVGCLE